MAIPSYVTFDGSPAPDTKSKPPWRPWTRKPGLPLHPYLLTLPWWSPSQPRRLPGSSLAIPGSFPTQALHVLSPVRNILPLTLPRPVHSEFLSLFKCSLLKEAVSVCPPSVPRCPHSPWPVLGVICITTPCEFLTYHSKISNDKVTLYDYI